jgi:creatinine amidohydrolase
LAEQTWPEVEKLDRDIVVIYPIAALEQHSRHLPFFTDSILCDAVVNRLEAALKKDVLVLPLQWLGASEHHLGMAGTLTAVAETHLKIISEPLRCLLKAGFKRVLIINGHGGNTDGFHLALRQLAVEFPTALLSGASYWDFASKEIATILEGGYKHVGHACEFETAMMLSVRPELVRKAEIADGGELLHASDVLRGVFMPLDMKRQTRQGGTGYPSLATAEKGKLLMDVVVAKGIGVVKALRAAPIPVS